MIEFWEKVKKVHFWALFAQIWANENFPKKLGSITFELLWTPNFMQNIWWRRGSNYEEIKHMYVVIVIAFSGPKFKTLGNTLHLFARM